MKEIPILFSTEMVQSILSGQKTMTRRILKVKGCKPFMPDNTWPLEEIIRWNKNYHPYGQPGDLLWVRETWCLTQPKDPETYYFGYKCGIQPYSSFEASEKFDFHSPDKWHPSIHMSKEAARIWLQVEGIRVERLHDISEDDAIAEGVSYITRTSGLCYMNYKIGEYVFPLTAKNSFKSLWEKINGPESWDINPWVWVIKFKVLSTTGKPNTEPG